MGESGYGVCRPGTTLGTVGTEHEEVVGEGLEWTGETRVDTHTEERREIEEREEIRETDWDGETKTGTEGRTKRHS